MALALRRQYRFRKRIGNLSKQAVVPVSDAQVVSMVIAVTNLEIVFDQPIILNGFPSSWITVGLAPNLRPISASLVSEVEILVVFADVLAGATDLIMTSYDPAVRTKSGGYATSGRFPTV